MHPCVTCDVLNAHGRTCVTYTCAKQSTHLCMYTCSHTPVYGATPHLCIVSLAIFIHNVFQVSKRRGPDPRSWGLSPEETLKVMKHNAASKAYKLFLTSSSLPTEEAKIGAREASRIARDEIGPDDVPSGL